jgi:hypothetical protein
MKFKEYFKRYGFLLVLGLNYLVIYTTFNFYRELYNIEFVGNRIIKINLKSDYQSKPSFIVNNNGKMTEFYSVFNNEHIFKGKIALGDEVCKASGTFDFIVVHQDGSADTIIQNPTFVYKLFFMDDNRLYRVKCP